MTTTTTTRVRYVDALRGLAIVLMVLDHVLVQVAPGHILRYTVTRLALPLFVGCSVVVFQGRVSSRSARLLALGVAVEVVTSVFWTGMPLPGPVALIGGMLLLFDRFPVLLRWLPTLALLGLLQSKYQPVGWGGYEPGLILAYAGLAGGFVHQLEGVADRCLPGWLAAIGRRPIWWYCGHLVALAVVFR